MQNTIIKSIVSLGLSCLSLSVLAAAAPQQPVDKNQCFGCHATAIKTLSTRGAHKNVNCVSCHDISPEHVKAPSRDNRPTTHFEYAACGQCHTEQHKDIMDPKYHYEWALKNTPPAYAQFRDIAGDNSFRDVQFRLPRFHSSIVTDLANVRSDGRYQYKKYTDLSKPGAPMWEALTDTRPNEGDKILPSKTLSLTWRPHKGREIMGRSDCLKCKSSDNILDYAYLGAKNPKAPLAFDDPDHKVLKTVNNSFNCITCHDPHSAEPRIVFDHLIEAMSHPKSSTWVFAAIRERSPFLRKPTRTICAVSATKATTALKLFTKIATVSSLIRKMLLTEPAGPSVRSSQLTRSNAGMS